MLARVDVFCWVCWVVGSLVDSIMFVGLLASVLPLVFSFSCVMWYSRLCFEEAKMFVLSAKEGCSVLRIIEESRGVSRAVHLGNVSVAWLLETMEALI